jgi:ribonuclease HI
VSRRVTVYTDGGARPNPGPGGWGAVLVEEGAGAEPRARELSGGAPLTTNNRMELTAAIEALAAVAAAEAAGAPPARLRLVTDSQYLRRGVTEWLPAWIARGWKRADGGAVENEDLWRRLAERVRGRRVEWRWVRGHAGDRGNERADALATAARRRFAGGELAPQAARATVHLKVSCRGGDGAWAARVRCDGEERLLGGSVHATSANRLDLEAAAAALESLPPGVSAAVFTGSEYLRQGATKWLPGWRHRGGRTPEGGAVKNLDAWQRLAAALAGRQVAWPDLDDAARAEVDGLERALAGRPA